MIGISSGDLVPETLIGTGGFADVWRARVGGEIRAIKCLKQPLSFGAENSMIIESYILSLLHHPNIVGFFGSKTEPGQPMHLVLEFMPHGELYNVIETTGPLPEKVARFCFLGLLDALGYLHAGGFAHRDIKLQNVLLDAEYVPKLADFGLACALIGRDGTALIQSPVGTRTYMAPEVLNQQPYDGTKYDLFALGIVLFNMVTGCPPFKWASKDDKYYQTLCTDPSTYWKAVSGWSSWGALSIDCQLLIQCLLAENPWERPSVIEVRATTWCQGPTQTLKDYLQERKQAAPLEGAQTGPASAKGQVQPTAARYGYAPHPVQRVQPK
jgi:serine/threonine protein kinase